MKHRPPQVPKQGAAARSGTRRTLWPVLALCVVVLASPAAAGADVGYEGPNYSGAASQPTAHKPQSKLWVTPDGVWWGVLWNSGAARYEIHKLDRAARVWRPTGTVVDTRSGSKADALWDGTRLYIASAGPSATSSADSMRLTRYSYDSARKTYSQDSGFPVTMATGGTTSAVIDKDSTGTLWGTYTRSGKVFVVHSTTNDTTWSAPLQVPATGSGGLHAEDISTIVAYDGKVGAMWSNQNSHAIYFASHVDGRPDGEWTSSTVLSGSEMADDHINLKALQGDDRGRLYAATKTSKNASSDPLMMLHVLDAGTWRSHVFGRVSEDHTRPMVMLDDENDQLYMFASSPCCGGGKIYYKRTSLSNISFQPGLGTLFMEDQGVKVNNVTASKQSLDGDTDLVALASVQDTKHYWYNEIDLPGGGSAPPDTTPPETTIDSGPSGTVNSPSASFGFSANEPATFQCRLDGGAFSACSSPTSYSGLASGAHTFEVRATDSAGNVDPTPASRTWTVGKDTTPPETTIDSGPSGTVNSPSASFGFSANEPATFECRLDGGAFSACSSPKSYSGLANGAHTFEVRATDSAGNVDPTPASRTWTVDVATTATLTFPAEADAYATEAQPASNFGTSPVLKTDDNSGLTDEQSYLRFRVSGATEPVVSAKVRAYVANGSTNGPAIFATDSLWSELGLTWNNRPPPMGTASDDKGAVAAGSFVEYDVTPLVTGNRTYDFVTMPTSSDGMDLASREDPNAARRPTLVLTLGGG